MSATSTVAELRDRISAGLTALADLPDDPQPEPVCYLPPLIPLPDPSGSLSGQVAALAAQAARRRTPGRKAQAWNRVGDLVADLFEAEPTRDSLAVGTRWVDHRPKHALPSRGNVSRMTPLLIQFGRLPDPTTTLAAAVRAADAT